MGGLPWDVAARDLPVPEAISQRRAALGIPQATPRAQEAPPQAAKRGQGQACGDGQTAPDTQDQSTKRSKSVYNIISTQGCLPNRWPEWFAPRSIVFEPKAIGAFDRSHNVTSDGTVVIVPTPGHTPGHVSVIVVYGDVSYFLAGDTTYTQQSLVEERVDGVSPSEAVSLRTMQTIVRYARNQPTVYLPTHDPESGDRLANAITVQVGEDVVA